MSLFWWVVLGLIVNELGGFILYCRSKWLIHMGVDGFA
jgi:hypothetical protein